MKSILALNNKLTSHLSSVIIILVDIIFTKNDFYCWGEGGDGCLGGLEILLRLVSELWKRLGSDWWASCGRDVAWIGGVSWGRNFALISGMSCGRDLGLVKCLNCGKDFASISVRAVEETWICVNKWFEN